MKKIWKLLRLLLWGSSDKPRIPLEPKDYLSQWLMYLPRVQAITQLKSESLQTKEDTIKGKTRESGT